MNLFRVRPLDETRPKLPLLHAQVHTHTPLNPLLPQKETQTQLNDFSLSLSVVTDVCKPRPLPPLCGLAALWASWVGLILSTSLSMWLGRGFSEGVALMWLISCIVSFLSSFLILEPLKVHTRMIAVYTPQH